MASCSCHKTRPKSEAAMSPGSRDVGSVWGEVPRFQVPHGEDGQDGARDIFGVNLRGEALGMAMVT